MNKIFEKGGKLYFLHSTIDAFETFLHVPGTVARKGAHVRDAVDLKRIMIIAVIAAAPAALFGMWNVGYQYSLATGLSWNILQAFWYGFLKVLPLYLVSYIVGLGIEFASAQIRGEEVNEGYLVSGFFIPLIVPVDVPLWMLAVAVAFAVIFGKEVFGGTGMNIINPAILTLHCSPEHSSSSPILTICQVRTAGSLGQARIWWTATAVLPHWPLQLMEWMP